MSKRNLASEYLKSISHNDDGPNPILKPPNSPKPLSQLINNSNNHSNSDKSPLANKNRSLSPVKKRILEKEKETLENKASNFIPRPDNIKAVKRTIFINNKNGNNNNNTNNNIIKNNTKIENDNNKLSNSERGRMGKISNAMSNSPSLKNLSKLKNIQSKLDKKTDISIENNVIKKPNKLPKTFSSKNLNINASNSNAIKHWIDNDRDNLKICSFVCRMIEIKNWIELILDKNINLDNNEILDFPDYLTNGILLVELVQKFDPTFTNKIYTGRNNNGINDRVQNFKMVNKEFKFTENIIKFLTFSKKIKLPNLFIFETNDLYEKKDIPKVIACLHALSCLMSMLNKAPPIQKMTKDDLSIGVDQLKQIKYKIGKPGVKYIDGFEEAVRVNVGDDIKHLVLIEMNPVKNVENPNLEVKKVEEIQEDDNIELEKITSGTSGNDKLNDITASSIDTNDLLNDSPESTPPQSPNHSILSSSSTILSSPVLLPPSPTKQAETNNARSLFNKVELSMLPSISDIHNKYSHLIKIEDNQLLNGPVDIDNIPPELVIPLQSLSRGSLVRFDLFVTKFMLKVNTAAIIEFQSLCRGILSRKNYETRSTIANEVPSESSILRTILQNKQTHGYLISHFSELQPYDSKIKFLQSVVRGMNERQKCWKVRKALLHETNFIIRLQSLIRGKILRANEEYLKKKIEYNSANANKWRGLKGKITITSIEKGQSIPRKTFRKPPPAHLPPQTDLDDAELFETFDNQSTPVTTSLDDNKTDLIPLPGHVPRRREAKLGNAKYVPNLPVEEPLNLVPSSTIRRSPTKSRLSSSKSDSPTKSRLSSSKTILIPISKTPPLSPIHSPVTSPSSSPTKSRLSSSKIHRSPTKIRLNSANTVRSPSPTPRSSSSSSILSRIEPLIPNIIKFQSVARGALERNNLNDQLDLLFSCEMIFESFIGHCRGSLVRRRQLKVLKNLRKDQNSIILIQSIFRGLEKRFEIDCRIDDLVALTPNIVSLQSLIRGDLIRKKITDRTNWFLREDNLKKIVKLQALIRGNKGLKDYKALINERNPPLSAVKKFIGLLGGMETEKNGRNILEIMKMKEEIKNEKKKVNVLLEELNKLRVKVELLKKNGIVLNDVDGLLRESFNNNDHDIGYDIIDEKENKAIDNDEIFVVVEKGEQDLRQAYGQFFWLLQNKFEYWGRIVNYVEMTGDEVEFSHGNMEDWILKCYNYSDVSNETDTSICRDECLIMKLVVYCCKLYFNGQNSEQFKEFVKSRRNVEYIDVKQWELLLMSYTNLPQQRTLAKKLLGDLVFLVTGDYDVSFECDPFKIYDKLCEQGVVEIQINIKNPLEIKQVEKIYIKNMTNLRKATYDVFNSLKKLVEILPPYIRCVCKEIFEHLKEQFNEVSETDWLAVVGSIFMKCFILPIFKHPENYSINIFAISENLEIVETIDENLKMMSIMLNQCVLMRPFNSKQNKYLVPLNPFVDELNDIMKDFLKGLVNIPNLDLSYQSSLLQTNDAKLKIKSDDILELIEIWKIFIDEVFGKKDYLNYLLTDIEKLRKDKKNFSKDTYGYIILDLIECDESMGDDVVGKAIMLEAKKYITYILQVQDGEDLVDVLVGEITPKEELKFQEIIKEEKKMIKKQQGIESVFERQAVDNIYNSTFPQVKKQALELIFELEKLGLVSQTNGYQEILNEIAKDIKNKTKQKDERNAELHIVVESLTKLKQREVTYAKKCREYQEKIDQEMFRKLSQSTTTIKDTNNKQFFSKLFSKQRRHNKQKSSNSASSFGSYKFTAKSLQERGVLKDMGKDLSKSTGSFTSSFMNKVNITISCSRKNEFTIEISGLKGVEKVSLDGMLKWQYDGTSRVELFGGEAVFGCNELLSLVLNKFYHV